MLIAFDIGGTKMRVASIKSNEIGEVHVVNTPHDPKSGLGEIVRFARLAAGRKKIRAAVGCIAGKIDAEGKLSNARNLLDWEGTNIAEILRRELQVPVHIYNDCELIGVGEAGEGAGVGSNVLAYITISTGVGGARIVDGVIDGKASDFVVGKIAVGDADLENMISGTAVKKRFGVEPRALSSQEIRDSLAAILGHALYEVVEKWQPDTIVLGGSMMVGKENTIPLGGVANELRASIESAHMPKLRLATLGDVGGLHGARIVAETLGL